MKNKKIKIRTLLMIVMVLIAITLVGLATLIFSRMFAYGFRTEFIPEGHHMGYVTVVDLEDLLINVGLRAALGAIAIALVPAFLVSRWLARDIKKSLASAQSITEENFVPINNSRIVEFDNLNDTLIDINTRLNIKNQNRKSIYDQLYHQSRTPLTIMKNVLEGIEDGVVEMDAEEVRVCQNQVDNLQELIDNMELMIDGSNQVVRMQLENFELTEVIKKIVTGYQRQFDTKGVALEVNHAGKITIFNDRFKISQAVYNLLSNAYKYTQPGGKVKIELREDDGQALITVTDNGRGIPPRDLEHIFKAFYRGEGVAQIPGQGIGLYMLKENIESCQGSVAVNSLPGDGSVFTLRVPLEYQED